MLKNLCLIVCVLNYVSAVPSLDFWCSGGSVFALSGLFLDLHLLKTPILSLQKTCRHPKLSRNSIMRWLVHNPFAMPLSIGGVPTILVLFSHPLSHYTTHCRFRNSKTRIDTYRDGKKMLNQHRKRYLLHIDEKNWATCGTLSNWKYTATVW